MADISCNLPLPLLKRLEEEKEVSEKSTTFIVQEALTLYFMAEDRERLDPVRDPLRYYPLLEAECTPDPPTPYMQNGVIVTKGMQEELQTILNESNNVRSINDPDVQEELSLIRERRKYPDIRSGSYAMEHLKRAGIDPMDVLQAKRDARAGKDYDKRLEKYFVLLESNE